MADLSIRDHRQPGWFFVDNEVVDRFGAHLGAYGLAVYCVLSRYARNESQEVKLSARDIAAALGISQDRVRKSLGDLADAGLIHLAIPERPAPGLFSVITLLNVKKEPNATRSVSGKTERHTFSSGPEPNATRSPYKEVKTNTETKTKTPSPFPPEDFSLVENQNKSGVVQYARAGERKKPASQADFDARDLRKLSDALNEIAKNSYAAIGTGAPSTPRKNFEWACDIAGISVARGLEVQERAKNWPADETLPEWAKGDWTKEFA